MSEANCRECFGGRWLVRVPYFDPNDGHKIKPRWKPLSRDWWDQSGSVNQAVALTTGIVKPCDCNADKCAPWAQRFRKVNGSAAAPAAEGAQF